MSDNYASAILGALRKTDTSKVWHQTDLMSTLYIGRQRHVMDCINAVFAHTCEENLHMAGEFTFSKAAHYDVGASDAVLNADDKLCNAAIESPLALPVYAKISFYAFRQKTARLPYGMWWRCIFPILIGLYEGLSSVEEDMLDYMRCINANYFQSDSPTSLDAT